MFPFTLDQVLATAAVVLGSATALLALLHTARGLIPATFISIDGKPVIWGLIVLEATVTSAAMYDPVGTGNWLHFIEYDAAVSVVAALIDQGVAASSLRDLLRKVVTVNGRTNAI